VISWNLPALEVLPNAIALHATFVIAVLDEFAALVVLFVLLLVERARRRSWKDITQPETGRVIAFQLGRIADALERSTLPREAQSRETQFSGIPPLGEEKTSGHVRLSIFGR
jgi:hypothetical protein